MDNKLLSAKYIYLDWNVIKYMKEPRIDKGDLDKRFKDVVFSLKKKYKFPYSMAHIKDRANRYSKEYYDKVKEDLEFAESINDRICVGIAANEPVLIKEEAMQKHFDNYISESIEETPVFEDKFPFLFQVDMNKIEKTHPMYDFLKERAGNLSSNGMEEFLQEIYKSIFNDVNKYKILRDYINKMDLKNGLNQTYSFRETMELDKLLFYMYPFLDSFQDNEDTLREKWPNIAERWFSLKNACPQQDLLLIQGYVLLDMHPLFAEKLKKGKNSLDNIIRDGNHCFYASKGHYFVSEDEYTRQKTEFLFKAYEIRTKVVSEAVFINTFDGSVD